MQVTVIGCGYVGLTTSVALAYIGHRINCIEQNEDLVNTLRKGCVPIFENGLQELLGLVRGRLSFGQWDSFDSTDVIIIAVGTPRKQNGDADLSHVEAVARELSCRLKGDVLPVIVNKSTVPIGSARRVESVINQGLSRRDVKAPVHVASNPEFLREGVALFDTFYPDRIIIGAKEELPVKVLSKMYAPILGQTFTAPDVVPRPAGYKPPPLITTSPTSAELIKYAANIFLALKISYINEIAGIAERVGADITEVARGIGQDKRIGHLYLNAGIGWGGSCFGKDIQALIRTAGHYGYEMPISKAAIQMNHYQREVVIKKLQSMLKVIRGSTIGLLGLSFKPNTDDLRDAPSIEIASKLIELGAHVKAYDPVAMDNCRKSYPKLEIEYVRGTEELASGTDALVLVTEWEEFARLPFDRLGALMRQKIIIDGRNVLNVHQLSRMGFKYLGVGY